MHRLLLAQSSCLSLEAHPEGCMWSEFNSQAREDKYRLSDVFSQKPEEAGIILCLLFNFFCHCY